jgi:hypothetical protein
MTAEVHSTDHRSASASGYDSSIVGEPQTMTNQRNKGSVPPLDAVRAAVVREWTNARRSELAQKLYRSLRDGYEISVEGELLRTTAARP